MITRSVNETLKLGETIAGKLQAGDIVCLFGDLGTGKTTFVKGMARALKIKPSKVHSPTFILMNMYEGTMPLYHFDLYRIDREKQLEDLGVEEFFYGKGISVVEWAERLGTFLPKEFLKIELRHKMENERVISISGSGRRFKILAKGFAS